MPALSRTSRAALALLVAVAPLAAAPAAALAATRIDSLFVTATRSPRPTADLVADVTLIEADEIARSGAQSVADVLQRQPGVEIVRNGGPGATSGVFLRGSNRGHALILVDGVRVASSTVGATSLEAIPLDAIERIEVLRGPASSLYGADAIGGVIQVFTRRGGERLSGYVNGGYGTYDTGTLAAGVGGASGAFRFSLDAGARRSDGFNAIVDPANFSYNPDRDGYENRSASASASFAWAPEQTLSASYLRNRLDNPFDAGRDFDDRTITTLSTWQIASSNRLAPWWTSQLTAAEGRHDSVSKTGFGESPYRTVQHQYAWQNAFTLPAGVLTLGYERREERVDATEFPVTSRDTDSVFAIYELSHGAHALQANVRLDDSNQFGRETTGSIAYGYRFAPGWRATAGASTGFKPPSFNDLYFPDFSNPDLAPETARNFELGLHGNGVAGEARWNARVVGWHNDVDDLIVFGCDANFVCRPDNVARATLAGVTLSGDIAWRGTTLAASLDLQSPEDDRTGRLLPRRARRHGVVTLGQQVGQAFAQVELVASSRRFDDAENQVPLAGYGIVNLTVEWPLGYGVTLFARADNIFDRDYQIASGYSTGGAQVFVGVRARR